MENAITIRGLKKVYKLYKRPSDRLKEALLPFIKTDAKEHYALNGVDIDVAKGETLGLIGKNGSGKSTLLKIVTGVLTPSSGTVSVNGRISALLELGAGFNQEYDGIENIYLNGLMLGFTEKEIDSRLDSILSFADIGEYVHQPVKTYSSGMFVRLAFALAINIDPEILIVDEALSVGDVFFQAKCYHKFEEFKEQGKTILFVSHDLGSIAKYADRVALLNEGTLLEIGEPKAVIDTYKQVLVGLEPIKSPSNQDASEPENIQIVNNEIAHDEILKNGSDNYVNNINNELNADGADTGQNLSVMPLDYGDSRAHILEIYIEDSRGRRVSSILKGERFTIFMKVEFLADLSAPIFAFTIKNAQGTELCGTNTMVEKAFLEPVRKGEVKLASFTQSLDLQGGDYLISFGVTGFSGDTFEVYHRLYDALRLTCVSEKNTVGVYDMNTKAEVRDA